MTSFVIRNALIVDGTGKPGFLGSVAVEDDQIVEVGTITSTGDVIIDAEGLVLAPGIIDSHSFRRSNHMGSYGLSVDFAWCYHRSYR